MAIIMAISISCKKNLHPDEEIIQVVPEPGKPVSVSIAGRVLDQNQRPVEGATISAGTLTVKSDLNGEFLVKDASIVADSAIVRIVKAGYFDGIRSFLAVEDRIHSVVIELNPRSETGRFTASVGGNVPLASGGNLNFQANSIIRVADQQPYRGVVAVHSAFIDPTSDGFENRMPGNLRAINERGREQFLESFGMMAVELKTESGEELQLDPAFPATIQFPIPSSLLSVAPNSMPLWFFNENNGYWIEEGTVVKKGMLYEGKVSHFTYWNCDIPHDRIFYRTHLVDGDGSPLSNVKVNISDPTSNLKGYVLSDNTGEVYFALPKDRLLELEILNKCGTPIFNSTIGPFARSTDEKPIRIESPALRPIVFEGAANNCEGNPVANGFAILSVGNSFTTAAIKDGQFKVVYMACTPEAISFELVLVDNETGAGHTIVEQVFSLPTYEAGTVELCNSVDVGEFVEINVGRTIYNFTEPDNLFSYTRSNGNNILTARHKVLERSVSIHFNDTIPGQYTGNASNVIFIDKDMRQATLYRTETDTLLINVQSFGMLGDYIVGDFVGSISDTFNELTVMISGKFRVRRQ